MSYQSQHSPKNEMRLNVNAIDRQHSEDVTATNSESVPLVQINNGETRPADSVDLNGDSDEINDIINKVVVKSDADDDDDDNKQNEEGFYNQDSEFPSIISSRAGGDGESELNGAKKPEAQPANNPAVSVSGSRLFPFYPGFAAKDLEGGSAAAAGDLESIPDVNVYQHKKTVAQGMMDLALFSANANQLRYVLEASSSHPYFYPGIVFISISLILQVAVGVGLIWNALYNVKDEREICIANKINNFTVIGIFLVTIANVFICAFGVASPAVIAVAPAAVASTTT